MPLVKSAAFFNVICLFEWYQFGFKLCLLTVQY
jgi:hypothetical protein